MPSAKVVLRDEPSIREKPTGSFPQILNTSNGTMLVEIQGTVNIGDLPLTGEEDATERAQPITQFTELGDLEFDETNPHVVTLVVGQRQKLVGKVVKLAQPLAVMKMPSSDDASEIPVTQILTHKVLFSDRPEPYMPAI